MESWLVLLVVVLVGGAASLNIYDTANVIRLEGYQAETHYVNTSDGYILQVDRIPHRRHHGISLDHNRPVVFCMHGLLAASNSYIMLGHEKSLAYNLADAGFDVWMGNARGNKNSRSHASLDPDQFRQKSEFFDFSWEEIGMIDIPAMIDYVLKYTGREKLHYIGHSQGGTTFLVMGSMRPEYNDKLESVHLLAGVGYMKHFPNHDLARVAALTDIIYSFATSIGMVELFPPNSESPSVTTTSDSCAGDNRFDYMCELVGVDQIMIHSSDIATDAFKDAEPAGAALKQIAHYGQNIRDGTFRRWNYGLLKNLRKYGSTSPPAYDLSLITANVTMHYTINDRFLDEQDVFAMAAVMPNCNVRKVTREDFLHEDFVAARDSKELVNNYIIEQINAASRFR